MTRPPVEIRTEADVVQLVDAGRGDSEYFDRFLSLLDERHPVYDGTGAPAVVRMRGALLLALGHRALPSIALPFVLEELESAHEPWLTAVAAHVLRKFPEPSPSFAAPLLSALLYIPHRDDVVRLGSYGGYGPDGDTTTATAEVLKTMAWLGGAGTECVPRLEDLIAQEPGPSTSQLAREAITAIREDSRPAPASCCGAGDAIQPGPSQTAAEIPDLLLEDHSGRRLTFSDAFHGRPTIVVFFYTRCDNPTKCPLTMYKFGSLQRLLRESGYGDSIGTAAITYDPDYDRPARLLQYAQSWGVSPDEHHRILRTVGNFSALRDYFELGVNYGESGIVNRHQIEAYVLDREGRIEFVWARRRWEERLLLRAAAALI